MGAALDAAFGDYFSLDKIVEPYQAPEIFVTRCGYADVTRGGNVRLWLCSDQPAGRDGTPGAWELKVKVIWEVEPLLACRAATGRWLAQQIQVARQRFIMPRDVQALM